MKSFFKKIFNFNNCGCKGSCASLSRNRKIAIAGSPNVGKSVLFNCLTGSYAVVSNYPGTTVEVTRGKLIVNKKEFEVIDTPGMYSMLPLTEEERVARNIFIDEKPSLIIHVVDAKNLERMLSMTLQLIETGMHVMLVVNIIDDAEKLGMSINALKLESELGIPVVLTAGAVGRGVDELKKRIGEYAC
jgi:ferrous iron transport protein B